MPAAFDEINCVNVVCINDTRAADTAQDLGEDVRWNLAPWEVSECRESNGDL